MLAAAQADPPRGKMTGAPCLTMSPSRDPLRPLKSAHKVRYVFRAALLRPLPFNVPRLCVRAEVIVTMLWAGPKVSTVQSTLART